MSNTTSTPTRSDKMGSTLNTILPGDDPLTNLRPVQVGINEYLVLSARNGAPTVHTVNLSNGPSCTCEDMHYNREDNEVCAHVAQVLLTADTTWSPEEMSMEALLNQLAEARDATDSIKELETLLGRLDEANRAGHDPTTGTSETSGKSTPQDPLSDLKDAMRDAGVPVEKLRFIEQPDYIAFEPDGYLEDQEYGAFVSFSQDNDPVEYAPDSEGPDNRIKKADVPEVA